ncbi:MAG: MarR family transcriptional regulator [Tissierellia bacterium]|nr:MarR family transcriptional regulator [Tissierellia bacterium]
MLEELFNDVYEKFKLNFYKSIFKGFEDREASLTPTEILCVEVINALGKPTIKELTEFMETSQSNMAYRVSNLMKKGYIKKIQSKEDKREYYLEPTEKFYKYYHVRTQYIDTVLGRLSEKFPREEIDILTKILDSMSNELMPEVTNFINSLKSKQGQ